MVSKGFFVSTQTGNAGVSLRGRGELPIFLRGVSIHAEAPYRTGRAYSEEDMKTLLSWVHELGGNYVRLAHYPHDERMTRLSDRTGILVWSEIPVYWAVEFDNPAVWPRPSSSCTR